MSPVFVDIGNSSIKVWKGACRAKSYSHSNRSVKSIVRQANGNGLWVSSVVPKVSRIFILEAKRVKVSLKILKPKDVPLRTLYRGGIGIDRLLGLFGALKLREKNSVVVDVGTAITVDFMNADGVHLGGRIMAGPEMIARSLTNKTAKLPYVSPKKGRGVKSLGKNTRESLAAGHRAYLQGIILEAEEEARKRFGAKYQVILTGGWSNGLRFGKLKVDPLLVLRAMRHLFQEH